MSDHQGHEPPLPLIPVSYSKPVTLLPVPGGDGVAWELCVVVVQVRWESHAAGLESVWGIDVPSPWDALAAVTPPAPRKAHALRRAEQLSKHELQDPAVLEVALFLRRVDPHRDLELAIVRRDGQLARNPLGAGEPEDRERLPAGEP